MSAVRFIFELDLPEDIAATISDPDAIESYSSAVVLARAIEHAVGGVTWRRATKEGEDA